MKKQVGLEWKSFKNHEDWFLFHVISIFRSQVIEGWSFCKKGNSLMYHVNCDVIVGKEEFMKILFVYNFISWSFWSIKFLPEIKLQGKFNLAPQTWFLDSQISSPRPLFRILDIWITRHWEFFELSFFDFMYPQMLPFHKVEKRQINFVAVTS